MNKKTLLLILAFASLIAVGTHLLFKPSNEMPQTHSVQDVKTVANNLNKLDATHTSELKKLKANNQFLVVKIQQSKGQVHVAQKRVSTLRNELQQLTSRQTLITKADTNNYVATCDSLQHELIYFINANSYKDSIVNEQVGYYELLIIAKDSTIVCLESDYQSMKANSNALLKLNTVLVNENKKTQKLCLRIKRKDRLVTGSAFLLAGIVTATQLRSTN
ncbi:MAG: hypothetical protein IPI46_09855 [Bacteroidetes bacterium]|nr:hypothetical protein [Bacteroidota bacterium]